ncbi:MAG: ketoacyl-ACP synthase III [Candidatus Mcinerneyibacterium aminivorans]|uniref:Beta-ketoacyl-[acyl-carrier-protein] synthase III n=1 Tax=Candidatus Mcinerneyibacterium aminivorans TaxID=2703815 RepID=A0A5D0MKH0_9BACT|nr:MAG: ketoacyl-ACP synthase III [Candidatus Mcinerneyibacterium aminivorans]
MPRAKIISTGSYLPEKVMTNNDLEEIVETSDEWITKRTGIKKRHIASDDQAASDLAVEAINNALKQAGMKAKELDLILVATVTPDTDFPSTGCWIQKKLKIKNIPAFDISAACSGFIYGLTTARSFIESGLYENIALVGVETFSKITNWNDRSTCVLFGDGAGAVILGPSEDEKSGILSSYLGADGSKGELLIKRAGGSLNPTTQKTLDNDMHYLEMEGREVFKQAVRVMKRSSIKALKTAGIEEKDIDLLITHQANIRIIDSLGKRLHVPDENVHVTVDEHANTSSASIPLALDDANRKGKIKRGDNVLLTAFGSGLTWGSVVLRW